MDKDHIHYVFIADTYLIWLSGVYKLSKVFICNKINERSSQACHNLDKLHIPPHENV